MNKNFKIALATVLTSVVAGLLIMATPALAFTGDAKVGNGNGFGIGAFFSGLVRLHDGGKTSINAGEATSGKASEGWKYASSTSAWKNLGNSAEIGVVDSVNANDIVLNSSINLSGTSTAATLVVTNASTTYKGATSTASLTSGEKVIVVGTTSTSSPNTITASIVIAFQNAWHFCKHLLSR